MKDESNDTPPLIVLGVDPGTRITGYALIQVQGRHYRLIDYGCIRPPATYKLSDRYLIIFEGLEELIGSYNPTELSVETQFVQKNIQSALKLGMARGIAIAAAKKKRLKVFEYSPSEAKRAVVGNGKASKYQVQGMVKQLLCLQEVPQPEDAADALAIAICHAQAAPHIRIKHEI